MVAPVEVRSLLYPSRLHSLPQDSARSML